MMDKLVSTFARRLLSGYLAIFLLYFSAKLYSYVYVINKSDGIVKDFTIDYTKGRGPSGKITRFKVPVIMYRTKDLTVSGGHDSRNLHEIIGPIMDLHHYQIGDTVLVYYSEGAPAEGKILMFTSFWMPIPAMIMLVFSCIVWTGYYNIRHMKKYKDS